jgi:hypothetical protein
MRGPTSVGSGRPERRWLRRQPDTRHIANLAAKLPVQITTWQDLIARYQEKFMPAAAGVFSCSKYNIAKLILSEDVGGWHARLRDLYNSAYPSEEVNNNLPLIRKFVTQLINKEVGKFVFERNPATFAGALALAQTKTATDVTFKTASPASIHAFANPSDNGVNYSGIGRGGGREGREKGGSSRPERREGEAGKCWICNSSSHQKSACPVWDKAFTMAQKESGGGSAPDREREAPMVQAAREQTVLRERARLLSLYISCVCVCEREPY